MGPEDAVEPLVRRPKDTLDSVFLFSIKTHGKGMNTPILEDSSAHRAQTCLTLPAEVQEPR